MFRRARPTIRPTRFKEVLDKVEIVETRKRTQSSQKPTHQTSQSQKTEQQTKQPLPTRASSQFPCSFCGKVFNNKFMLDRHVAIHTGEKKHVCPECKKSFIQKTDLDRHVATHSDSKPFVCEIQGCGKGHKTMKNLSCHIFRAHFCQYDGQTSSRKRVKDTEIEMHYRCDICRKSCPSWISYMRHISLHGSYRILTGEELKIQNEKMRVHSPIRIVDCTQDSGSSQRSYSKAVVPTRILVNKIPYSSNSKSTDDIAVTQNQKIGYEFVDENEFLPDENDPHELIRRHMKLVKTCNEPDFIWDDDETSLKLEPEDEPSSVIETSAYHFETE